MPEAIKNPEDVKRVQTRVISNFLDAIDARELEVEGEMSPGEKAIKQFVLQSIIDDREVYPDLGGIINDSNLTAAHSWSVATDTLLLRTRYEGDHGAHSGIMSLLQLATNGDPRDNVEELLRISESFLSEKNQSSFRQTIET